MRAHSKETQTSLTPRMAMEIFRKVMAALLKT